jgi:hypothetical protein
MAAERGGSHGPSGALTGLGVIGGARWDGATAEWLSKTCERATCAERSSEPIQLPVIGSNPQENSGLPPSLSISTTSSHQERSNWPPG